MAAIDPAVLAAQNKRKIEKDKRRKNYHDSQVQGTNNSSIVSKRSVEMIYNPITDPEAHDWFKYFVPKGKRRSPAINRGYWVRMESIKQAVRRIQDRYEGKIRVVNLGCGFDPFPFKTLAETTDSIEFFDFDYPELVAKKLTMIKGAPEILNVIGKEQEIDQTHRDLGVILSTSTYKLVGCDLKQTSAYKNQLNCLMHSGVPTIFIAEVSLAYMKPEHANVVVSISSKLPNSHFLVLEQIMPSGDSHFFAQKMLYHFSHLRSPLLCVETYSTKQKQGDRFREFFPKVEIIDLFESWTQMVSTELKQLVAQVEDFDEWEEFIIFCQHYVVIHATNSDEMIFEVSEDLPLIDVVKPLAISTMSSTYQAKFPASTSTKNRIYAHGGMFQTRSNDLNILGEESLSRVQIEGGQPSARMCHTLSDLGDENVMLIGGRTRPGANLHDVWIYNERAKSWKHVGDIDDSLSRHSTVSLKNGSVLVFANGEFSKLGFKNGDFSVINPTVKGSIPALISCSMSYDITRNLGFIVGGMVEQAGPTINDELFQFKLVDAEVHVERLCKNPHFARIGCLTKIENDSLVIIGGAGKNLQDQNSTVIEYDVLRGSLTGLSIPDLIWKTYPVFVGSQLAGNAIVGGGAVCYSFGSCYNSGYILH